MINFSKCSVSTVLTIADYRRCVLARAEKIRLLDSDELDFISAYELFNCGACPVDDLRVALSKICVL